jgi:small-conductance mechanosensitive channel
VDKIIDRLLTWATATLKRGLAWATTREPSGFEYLAGVMLQAQIEGLQAELGKQDKLLAETVQECDSALARAAALSRETIGLHLQLDALRSQMPDPAVLQQTSVALAESEAKIARLETALADSERRATAAERETVRLQAALARAEAANQALREKPVKAPILIDDAQTPPLAPEPKPPASTGKAARPGGAVRTAPVTGGSARSGKRLQDMATV